MDFQFTATCEGTYESLTDADAQTVDGVIMRLLGDLVSVWARHNRVVGDKGEAWIVTFWRRDTEFSLYWNYFDDETVVLLMLATTSMG